MSAERLRQAAALLRERAEAATPGPWGWRHFGDDPQSVCRVVSYKVDPWAVVADDIWPEKDAAYVARMAPPVALALADWLEDHAINADYWTQELAANPDSDPMRFVAGDSADRLADAILGDAS